MFPLYADADARPKKGGAAAEALVWHLRQGVLDAQVWPSGEKGKEPSSADLIPEEALRNLLVRFDRRLLFLIYDRSSLDLSYGEKDKKRVNDRLEELQERRRARRPSSSRATGTISSG